MIFYYLLIIAMPLSQHPLWASDDMLGHQTG